MKSSQIIEVEDHEWAEGLSEESEAEDSTERDPDWVHNAVFPSSPDTPMFPRAQKRHSRRTRSTETSSSSLIKITGRLQVCEKTN